MSDQESNEGFKIEGTIHGKPVSEYVQEQIELNKMRPRILIAVLATLAALLFIWAAISQYKLQQNKKLIQDAKDLKAMYGSASSNINTARRVNDSLQRLVLQLQADNDLLAENSDNQLGVFFEVQIGSFTDFNMNQYLENLAYLRQEKHDNKTQLLLGRFRSFNKALLFERDLKKMGIRNAFLVGRIDGKLVTYQEALDASGQDNN